MQSSFLDQMFTEVENGEHFATNLGARDELGRIQRPCDPEKLHRVTTRTFVLAIYADGENENR